MGRLRVVSDGTAHNSHVYDVDSGKEIVGVTSVRVEVGVGDTDARIRIEAYPGSIDLTMEGEVVLYCQSCCDELNEGRIQQVTALRNELKIQRTRASRWKEAARALMWRKNEVTPEQLDQTVSAIARVIRYLESDTPRTEEEHAKLAQKLREGLHSIGRAPW